MTDRARVIHSFFRTSPAVGRRVTTARGPAGGGQEIHLTAERGYDLVDQQDRSVVTRRTHGLSVHLSQGAGAALAPAQQED